jgi:Flp pilus assembly pilin Flp
MFRNSRFPGFRHPATDFLVAYLRGRVERARSEEDRGASAIEWVVIAAVVVSIVGIVGGILYTALRDRAQDVERCIDGVDGSEACEP